MKHLLLAAALLTAGPAFAQSNGKADWRADVAAKLAEAATGTRFGLVVVDAEGREIIAINPDGRFIPASNTKMFTTAAAFREIPGIDAPDKAAGAQVRMEGRDVVLVGRGDARMSSADDCKADCLATLADAVAARTRYVEDVIGDDTIFPDTRWSPGMSWNNIPSSSGTGISALTLDDNELALTVAPGKVGEAPNVGGWPYYVVDNRARTVAGDGIALGFDRAPNGMTLILTGTIGVDSKPRALQLGIDDPAHYAAWRLKTLLEARGVKVKGQVRARHRIWVPEDEPLGRDEGPVPHTAGPAPLAQLTPAPFAEDLKYINKVSQNLHAELAMRRIGWQQGSGSLADGIARVEAMLNEAGVPRTAWDLSDGSGMSSYNRVAPRGVMKMLRWIATQPWGAQWRDTLPIAGKDGTLARRFKDTPLEGRLWAKTGTLNATNALAGYMVAKSGRTLTFAIYANDVPSDAGATAFMDAALNIVAGGN
jgi:serine-type D-Ala-D-Ala carboxypeptidase/endopeptidase (penicillin-binding protein 4)